MQAYKPRAANALMFMILMVMSVITVVGQGESNRRLNLMQRRTPIVINATIVDWSYDDYVIRARAGQKLSVRIASADKDVYFMVIPTRDKGRTLNSRQPTEWTGEVARTGDYMIHVGSVKGNGSYKLELELQ